MREQAVSLDNLPSRVKIAVKLMNELRELEQKLNEIARKINQGCSDPQLLEHLKEINRRANQIEREIELLVAL